MLKNYNKIGVVIDPSYMFHDTGAGHPESSDRLTAVKGALEGLSDIIAEIKPRKASREELLLVHSPSYVDRILKMETSDIKMLDPDTAFSPGSKEAALKAVGGVLAAVDKVVTGPIRRVFCAVRPPGHHAERDRAMGFCIFNNIAIAAAYSLGKSDIVRAAIVDWDLHHGNGTQSAFYDSKDVLYVSLHQYPCYPGTGSSMERGEGEGRGFTVNIPMSPGSGVDEYRRAFGTTVIPAVDQFRPDLIFISAGFDAHRDDPLGNIYLTTEYFGEMTAQLKELSDKHCGGRMISVLEGGYNTEALKESVKIHIRELAGK